MQPTLTAIVPVFNDETNILRCLDSLYNQTFSDIEIVVVNDASTDHTLEVLEKYKQTHPITIINMEKNSGAGCCRNVGVEAANSPYVTFVDSDDWVDMSVYTRCFEEVSKNPDIIIFGLSYDYVKHNHREEKYRYSTVYEMPGEFALSIYAHTIPNEISITPIVNNKVYRKQFLTDNGISFSEQIRYQEDDIFTFEVLAKASKVVIASNCFYHYCQRDNSLIHCISEFAIHNFIAAYLALETTLRKDNLFEKHKKAFYLKFKSSFLGVLKRILDYELDTKKRNKLICILFASLIENYDMAEVLDTFDFSIIRRIL